MARRYDHSREELRGLALVATRTIVAHDGVGALSTRKVAKEIGYSVGTIYNLYENLDDLIVHLNADTLDRLFSDLDAVATQGVPETDLLSMAEAYIAFTQRNLNLWNSLFDHHLPPGQELPDWYAPKVERLLSLIERIIAPEFTAAEVQECRNAARVLWSALHGICSLASGEKLDIVASQSANEMTALLVGNFMAGLRVNRDGKGQ